MADLNFCAAAIDATNRSTNTYIKFLSANDTGLTGGHQSGVLLSKKTCPMIFGELPKEHIAKRENIRIVWQDDKTGCEKTFLNALKPVIEEGSYLTWVGEEGGEWGMVF